MAHRRASCDAFCALDDFSPAWSCISSAHTASIVIVRFLGGISFSFYTISYMGLIIGRTKASETRTVLALYTVTLSGLVNMLAAPIASALFDANGACPLYVFAMTGYVLGAIILWLARPREQHVEILQPVSSQNLT